MGGADVVGGEQLLAGTLPDDAAVIDDEKAVGDGNTDIEALLDE